MHTYTCNVTVCLIVIASLTVLTIIVYLYILAVFPSSSGIAISGAVTGYVTAICNSKWKLQTIIICCYTYSGKL